MTPAGFSQLCDASSLMPRGPLSPFFRMDLSKIPLRTLCDRTDQWPEWTQCQQCIIPAIRGLLRGELRDQLDKISDTMRRRALNEFLLCWLS